ncbi:UPF0496 protein 4 [Musa troglodytarum]|uniref:UPF0496 protein 4 n=1 Tax=Musa troglodytarum TaxID=320322 RepID=A0A9E7FNA8_9LILI|nr:UPF0496 protein 4 [Musa troglodytarum]
MRNGSAYIWMSLAMEFLSDAHNSIKTFINELQLPVSDWDVKLLDVCIAVSSELSRLDQGQLLLQYVLHLVDISATSLSGCSRALIDLHVSADFLWFEAFSDLQAIVNEEIKRQVVGGKVVPFNEIEAVKICASRLHDLANHVSCKGEPVQDTSGINHEDEVPAPGKNTDFERWRLQGCVTNLDSAAKKLGHELGSLSNQANDFFEIILMGRDALLCNLRMPAVTHDSSINDIRNSLCRGLRMEILVLEVNNLMHIGESRRLTIVVLRHGL